MLVNVCGKEASDFGRMAKCSIFTVQNCLSQSGVILLKDNPAFYGYGKGRWLTAIIV